MIHVGLHIHESHVKSFFFYCNYRMALTATLFGTKPSPYYRPPELRIKVLLVKDQARVITWEFKESNAVAKTTKINKIVAITDGETVTKVTMFEEFSSKIVEGKSYLMRGYSLRGDSPPYYVLITRDTTFFRTSPVISKDGLMEQARALLCPLSLQRNLWEVKDSKGLLTVEGEIVQVC